ncbi:MAG TPA: hypothetical protein VLJ59_10545 [Mycobacteriales bacterium]|nr:hypothetical protein [Mycobacteriales bacterium]
MLLLWLGLVVAPFLVVGLYLDLQARRRHARSGVDGRAVGRARVVAEGRAAEYGAANHHVDGSGPASY